MLKERASGILLPVFSLPGECGIGDFGPSAYRWIDLLKNNLQKYWQVLPLNSSFGYSPYHISSAFAGNPLFISPEILAQKGLLQEKELLPGRSFAPVNKIHYTKVAAYKLKLFETAFARFQSGKERKADFTEFREEHQRWLDEYAFFSALRRRFGNQSWHAWPREIRERKNPALQKARDELDEAIRF